LFGNAADDQKDRSMVSKIIILCCQLVLLPVCLAAPTAPAVPVIPITPTTQTTPTTSTIQLSESLPAGAERDRFVDVLARARSYMSAGADGARSDVAGTSERKSIREAGNDVAMYALGLIGIGYRYGGKTPETGLDCSGMVAYIFQKVAGLRVAGSAADIALHGNPVARPALRPGDLVFFNTMSRSLSHVGIYIGGQRFIHAPSTNGKVRIDRLDDNYYAQRYEMARSYFD
jgi:cell wall-associated NlpC family hydrolase